MVAVFPAFERIQFSIARPYAALKGLKQVLSSGCNLWLIWGGIVSKITPLALARSTAAKEICVSWLSRMTSTFFSMLHLVCLMKC